MKSIHFRMVNEKNTKLVRIHIKFLEDILNKLKEIMAKKRGIEINELSYAEVSLELRNRINSKGGLKD